MEAVPARGDPQQDDALPHVEIDHGLSELDDRAAGLVSQHGRHGLLEHTAGQRQVGVTHAGLIDPYPDLFGTDGLEMDRLHDHRFTHGPQHSRAYRVRVVAGRRPLGFGRHRCTDLTSSTSAMPYSPISLPMPDCL